MAKGPSVKLNAIILRGKLAAFPTVKVREASLKKTSAMAAPIAII
jgi:hypothetical protein